MWHLELSAGTREDELEKVSPRQVNGPASGRDDIGPDLLQRHGVTGLGGPDG